MSGKVSPIPTSSLSPREWQGEFAKAVTAQESASSYLRGKILSGALRPGDRVSQKYTADAVGCSIVPVREALKVLEGEGSVRYVPQRGFFVATLNVSELREIYRMRELLETEAIALAVPRITGEDIEQLAEHIQTVERAGQVGNVEVMAAANRDFHFQLFDRCGQTRLSTVIRLLWQWTEGFRGLYYSEDANRTRVAAEHRQILAAVARRDSEAAVRCQREHRQNTVLVLEEAFRSDVLGVAGSMQELPPSGRRAASGN